MKKQYMLSREREKKYNDDGHPDSKFGNKLDALQKYEISNI